MALFKSEIWDDLLERVLAFNEIREKDPAKAVEIAMEVADQYIDLAGIKGITTEKRLDLMEKSATWKNIADNLEQKYS